MATGIRIRVTTPGNLYNVMVMFVSHYQDISEKDV